MLLKFVLIVVFLILILVGYLMYSEYRDDLRFRGERFRDSRGMDYLLDAIIPNDTRILDNRLFRLFGSPTTEYVSVGNNRAISKSGASVRDFYVVKLICLLVSIVLSFSIMYTNFLNNRVAVFEKSRDLPFLISEADYQVLVDGLSFQTLDYISDIKKINNSKKLVENPADYINIDSGLIYSSVKDMYDDYNSSFNMGVIIVGLLVVLLGWFLPNIVVDFMHNIMIKNSDFEFSKLEGYIYINCHKRVSEILKGLCNESIFYRTQLEAFSLRYQEDRGLSYELILSEKQFSENFRVLIGYLKLLEDSDVKFVKETIKINQDNFRDKLKKSILKDMDNKSRVILGILFFTIIANSIVLLVSLIKLGNF